MPSQSPTAQATRLLAAYPAAWPGRRHEARALLAAWHRLARAGTYCLLPAWLTAGLPRTFPPGP
jgi:hypothetical protein